MRASNARLYQSSCSIVVPSISTSTTPTSSRTGALLSEVVSIETEDHQKNTAETKPPTGVTLSKGLIKSHFPALSLNAITHLDLSLESIAKVLCSLTRLSILQTITD
jgi:hypothetical protein